MPSNLIAPRPRSSRTAINLAISSMLLGGAAHAADFGLNAGSYTLSAPLSFNTSSIGSTGHGALTISGNGKLTSGLTTLGSQSSGVGSITVTGSSASYVGNDQLTIGDAGSGTFTVQNGAALVMNNGQATFLGRSGGTGVLNITGAGSSYTSTGHIHMGWTSSGTLNVSNGGSVHAEAGYLGFNTGANGFLNVSGAGSSFVVNWLGDGVNGSGTVVVSNGGTLNTNFGQIASGGGSSGSLTVQDAGSLWQVGNILNVGLSARGTLSVSNGGTVNSAQTVIAASTASASSSAVVAGTGAVLNAGSSLQIGQAASGLLQVQNGGSISVAGGVTQLGVQAGTTGTLVIGAQAGQAATAAGSFSSASLSAGAGQGVLLLNHTSTGYQLASTISGNIAVNAQAGVTILSGNSSWSGGTQIGIAGTLQVGNGGTSGAITGNVLDNGKLAFNRSDNQTFAGVISGSGALVQSGAGTTVLTANNTNTGGTTISAGTLQIGNGGTSGAITGDVLNNGTLAFNRGDNQTFAGTIGGSGALVQSGAGTTVLTANNTNTGGTTISSGTLQIGNGGTSGAITGDVLNNATLAFNRSDNQTFAGTISGSGALVQSGAGTTTLTANNTNTGGTTISSGTLQIGNGGTSGAITGDVLNNATLAFNRSDNQAFAGTISGSGALVQSGSGSLTLAANNLYSGGTLIAQGTLAGQAGSFGSGQIVDNATLVLQQEQNALLGNTLSGSGSLRKQGVGRLIVAGQNDFSGHTTVAQGELQVNGALAQSSVEVQAGSTLSGVGSVGDLLASGQSMVAPGNAASDASFSRFKASSVAPSTALGQLTVAGNFTQAAGATLLIRTLPGSNQSDLLQVDGQATLDEGALLLVHRVGTQPYSVHAHYTVLHADGGVVWRGYEVQGDTSLSRFLSLRASYDAQNVYLDILQTRALTDAAGTPNQRATASGLDGLSGSNSYRDSITSLNDDSQVQRALDLGSGEIHASVKATLLQQDDEAQRAALNAARGCDWAVQLCDTPQWWGRTYTQRLATPGDGNASALVGELNGAVIGVQVDVNDWRLGAYGGYARGRYSVDNLASLAHSNNGEVGLSVAHRYGPVDLRGGGLFGAYHIDSQRTASVADNTQQLQAAYTARGGRLFAEVALPLQAASTHIEPYLSATAVGLATPAFHENGGDAALAASAEKDGRIFSDTGVRMASQLAQSMNWQASAALRHRYGPATATSTFQFDGGPGFDIASAATARNSALLELGLDAQLSQQASAHVSYSGQVGHGVNERTLQANLIWKF